MRFEMAQVNLGASPKILDSVKVNAFHRQPVIRAGLAKWLEQAGVCGLDIKSNAAETLNCQEETVLLLGIESILDLEGSSFRRLARRFASKTVVVATCSQLDRSGRRLPRNVGSVISPCSALGEFIHAILAVTNHSTFIDPNLSAAWSRVKAEPAFELTNRQLEVLQLIADGKTSIQIAGLLGLRKKTVENHRAAIKERMRVDSAAQMVNKAHLRGIC